VRRLAAVTGLNKDTVAAHRRQAIESGWLIAKGSSTAPNREVLTALPDAVAVDQVERLSSESGQLLSSAVRQQKTEVVPELSGPKGAAVRTQPLICPSGSDIPLLPLPPPRNGIAGSVDTQVDADRLRSPQSRLRAWMLSNDNARKYQHDPEALARLAPLDCRFPGYERFIGKLTGRA
jgi:hypothetical protein